MTTPWQQLHQHWLGVLAEADPEVFAGRVDVRIADALADVAETVILRDRPVSGALRRFGETLGADGWPLPRVHAWVGVVAATMPRRTRRRLTDLAATGHLARGWADQHLRGTRHAACIDAITGLVTPLVLAVRMHETIAACRARGVDPTDRLLVVVADLDLGAVPRRERDAVLMTAAALMSCRFPDDTVARCEGRLVALLDIPQLTDELVAQLAADLQLLVGSAHPIVWTDVVPADDDQIDRYVAALSEPLAA